MGSSVKLATRILCLDMVECCFGSSVRFALPLYVDTDFTTFTAYFVFLYFAIFYAQLSCNATDCSRYIAISANDKHLFYALVF